jgi:hypothetical protein
VPGHALLSQQRWHLAVRVLLLLLLLVQGACILRQSRSNAELPAGLTC